MMIILTVLEKGNNTEKGDCHYKDIAICIVNNDIYSILLNQNTSFGVR